MHKEGRFILIYSLGVSNLRPERSTPLDLWWTCQMAMAGKPMVEQSAYLPARKQKRKYKGPGSHRPLQGHGLDDLKISHEAPTPKGPASPWPPWGPSAHRTLGDLIQIISFIFRKKKKVNVP
jgi:hypothetical protein